TVIVAWPLPIGRATPSSIVTTCGLLDSNVRPSASCPTYCPLRDSSARSVWYACGPESLTSPGSSVSVTSAKITGAVQQQMRKTAGARKPTSLVRVTLWKDIETHLHRVFPAKSGKWWEAFVAGRCECGSAAEIDASNGGT